MKNLNLIKINNVKIFIIFLLLMFTLPFLNSIGFLYAEFETEPDTVKTHIVKENENLADISYIYYSKSDRNRGAHWLHIYEYNVMKGHIDAEKQPVKKYGKSNAVVKIFVGSKLLIPIYKNAQYPSIDKLFDKYSFEGVSLSYTDEELIPKPDKEKSPENQLKKDELIDIEDEETSLHTEEEDAGEEENLIDIEGEDMMEIEDEEKEKKEEYLDLVMEDYKDKMDEDRETTATDSTKEEEAVYTEMNWAGMFKLDYEDLKSKLMEKDELSKENESILASLKDYTIDLDKENMTVSIYQNEQTRTGTVEDNKDGTLDLVFDDSSLNLRVRVKTDEDGYLYLETVHTFTKMILLHQ